MRRRDLLKLGLTTVPLLILPTASALNQRKRYAMLIDVLRCYGCMACVAACAAENNVPIGAFRTWVERYVRADGNVVFVPKQCNHCENPPCVKSCPTGATFKREDGLVLINDEICIGCGACIQACPYGARFINLVKGVVDKCTFCDHRLAKGLLPACVEACPTAARIFGDISDLSSEIRKLVESSNVQILRSWTYTEPEIYYKNLPKEADI